MQYSKWIKWRLVTWKSEPQLLWELHSFNLNPFVACAMHPFLTMLGNMSRKYRWNWQFLNHFESTEPLDVRLAACEAEPRLDTLVTNSCRILGSRAPSALSMKVKNGGTTSRCLHFPDFGFWYLENCQSVPSSWCLPFLYMEYFMCIYIYTKYTKYTIKNNIIQSLITVRSVFHGVCCHCESS